MTTLIAYIGAAPTNTSKTMLIIALVLFVIAVIEPLLWTAARRVYLSFLAAGLCFLTLAFLLK